jgi:serine/threonine-protein kinase
MSDSGPIPVREGDLLAGKYRVERVLGIGGMGIVVAALHEQLDQRVAIKFVREEALGNEEAVARFLREARAAVKLKSEHAAKVLDVGTLDTGAPYMVMEFLEGSDLAAVLGDRGPLPVEVAAEYVLQACEAVAEAHAAGIVHRDLKPHNLFLARTVGGAPRVKVLDFGVSKSLSQSGGEGALTQTRSMLGSPLYMSPEQMRSSRNVDARSDVWALGVVLFELLTQRWPFEAETMPELCLKVVSEAPQSLPALRNDVPQEMVAIVERCLQREPEKRFANAAELASALEPFVPAASRVIAERARMAIGSSTGTRRMESPLVAASAPARTGPTPAAWGSGQGQAAAQAGDKKRGTGMWIGIGIAAAAAVAGAVFLLRPHADAPASASPPSPAAPQAPAAPATSLPAATAATTATTAAAAPAPSPGPATNSPSPTDSAPPAPASSAASMLPAKPAAAPRVGADRAEKAEKAPKPAKPKNGDDDIPSLR